jgi:hypothetical protein
MKNALMHHDQSHDNIKGTLTTTACVMARKIEPRHHSIAHTLEATHPTSSDGNVLPNEGRHRRRSSLSATTTNALKYDRIQRQQAAFQHVSVRLKETFRGDPASLRSWVEPDTTTDRCRIRMHFFGAGSYPDI